MGTTEYSVVYIQDLSTPELREYANDLFELLGRAAVRKAVFKHTVEEMKGTLRGPLDALQRGDQPFGPLGNRILVDSSHAAYARETLNNLEGRVEGLGFEILDADAFSTPGGSSTVTMLPRRGYGTTSEL